MDLTKINTPFVYYVEMYDSEEKEWKKPEKRFYAVKQNIYDFPNNSMRRNFKSTK